MVIHLCPTWIFQKGNTPRGIFTPAAVIRKRTALLSIRNAIKFHHNPIQVGKHHTFQCIYTGSPENLSTNQSDTFFSPLWSVAMIELHPWRHSTQGALSEGSHCQLRFLPLDVLSPNNHVRRFFFVAAHVFNAGRSCDHRLRTML
jgi:hypothetical protein